MSGHDIHTTCGPALLLAGPGTGKTFSLAKRIKYLVEELGVPPSEITVVTFTASAAKNMRDKISDETRPELYLPYSQQPKAITTLHSLGYKMLRENASYLGMGEHLNVVADDYLRSILIGDAAQLAGFRRDDGKDTERCRQFGSCRPDATKIKCTICQKYRDILHSSNAIDYDEMILLACSVLNEKPEILGRHKETTKNLLVDEYQDINPAQFELIFLLSEGQREGLFLVGDDDQSIYSWRGGSPRFIRRFQSDFGPNAKVIPLEKSYRCHRDILEGALRVVEKFDPQRLPKGDFQYENEYGPKIQIHNTPSDEKEAIAVRRVIESALPSQDVLVLYPQRKFASAIIDNLRAARIPFSAIAGPAGSGFPLIATLYNWLRIPEDSLSFRRCLQAFLEGPASGIPSSRVRKPEKKEAREGAFHQMSNLWQGVISGGAASLWAALESFNKQASYAPAYEFFHDLRTLFAEKGSIVEFSRSVVERIAPWTNIHGFLSEVSSWVDLEAQSASMGDPSTVRIMSFERAKGLEAKVVCVLGLEDGTMPRDTGERSIAEQSRLFFVSMTRAINELHLFHARKRSGAVAQRNIYEKGGQPRIKRSRFIDVIPDINTEEVFHPA